ncbi:hypothetical protein BC939DRAFT_437583, partial [Gamsiella multidivaricata]|uniref:uncharacterized protein n=1 Tax=Gamsiella multidivaricata TaxID=101098 RepID=UPI00221F37E1
MSGLRALQLCSKQMHAARVDLDTSQPEKVRCGTRLVLLRGRLPIFPQISSGIHSLAIKRRG